MAGPAAWADVPALRCSAATLKGAYLYNPVGMPDVDSGREV
ncbi:MULTISPECIES: hypothetical protein [unclassified Synechococcus]|nr:MULTISPECIES: hypothetical protein [unclassified Synechococcus]